MLDFFKGWRRKAGCVLLVTTCAVTVVWARSHHRTEEMYVPCTESSILVGTARGCLFVKLERLLPDWPRHGFAVKTMAYDPDWPEDPLYWWMPDCQAPSRQTRFGGYRYVKVVANDQSPSEFELWFIPFWSLVLPLTLSSAWLILWKPRKKPEVNPSSSAPIPKP